MRTIQVISNAFRCMINYVRANEWRRIGQRQIQLSSIANGGGDIVSSFFSACRHRCNDALLKMRTFDQLKLILCDKSAPPTVTASGNNNYIVIASELAPSVWAHFSLSSFFLSFVISIHIMDFNWQALTVNTQGISSHRIHTQCSLVWFFYRSLRANEKKLYSNERQLQKRMNDASTNETKLTRWQRGGDGGLHSTTSAWRKKKHETSGIHLCRNLHRVRSTGDTNINCNRQMHVSHDSHTPVREVKPLWGTIVGRKNEFERSEREKKWITIHNSQANARMHGRRDWAINAADAVSSSRVQRNQIGSLNVRMKLLRCIRT